MTRCGNCASMRPASNDGFVGYCATYLTWRRVEPVVTDCPDWSSDEQVRAELSGAVSHDTRVCGDCVCFNGGEVGACTPVGARRAASQACHRYFSTAQLNAPLYGAKA